MPAVARVVNETTDLLLHQVPDPTGKIKLGKTTAGLITVGGPGRHLAEGGAFYEGNLGGCCCCRGKRVECPDRTPVGAARLTYVVAACRVKYRSKARYYCRDALNVLIEGGDWC